ncbi:MAG: FixH family protein [Gammaproteobacteria bacterium]|nr:FixH family protein [Gammaproteobacteria bacterium]
MQSEDDKKPWYRQPLVWLVISFPAIAVIFGISLLILSISIDDGVVVDDYYKKGKEINRVLTRDKKAEEMGIRGVSVYAAENRRFSVTLASSSGVSMDDMDIQLTLLHATRGGMDISVPLDLSNEPGLYQVTLNTALALGPWHVQIGNEDWRVHGRIHIPDSYTSPLSTR